ncbi:hypothetical protein [Mesorhizobium sp.]|nr:hypothetical protein [Mesorhizobium sp.]
MTLGVVGARHRRQRLSSFIASTGFACATALALDVEVDALAKKL